MDEAVVQEQQDNRGQWFVVQTLSGKENKVRDSILRQIKQGDEVPVYDAFFPTEKVSSYKRDRKVLTTSKTLPGYVFVRMDLYREDGSVDEKAWYFIRSVQGVLGFLGGNDRPVPLRQDEIEALLPKPEGEEQNVTRCEFKLGDRVQIKEDAFEGFEGQVQEIDNERGRLVVSVSVFGRSTPVDLGFWQVEKLS